MDDFPASHVSELGGVSKKTVFESLGCFSPICWHVNWVEIRVALLETDSLPRKIGGLSRHFIFATIDFHGRAVGFGRAGCMTMLINNANTCHIEYTPLEERPFHPNPPEAQLTPVPNLENLAKPSKSETGRSFYWRKCPHSLSSQKMC